MGVLCRERHMGDMLCRSSLPLLCLHFWSVEQACTLCYDLNGVQALLSLGHMVLGLAALTK